MNCQSIKNNRSSLKESVDYIKPDAIIGCESWPSSDHTNSQIIPCGYQTNVFRNDRKKIEVECLSMSMKVQPLWK